MLVQAPCIYQINIPVRSFTLQWNLRQPNTGSVFVVVCANSNANPFPAKPTSYRCWSSFGTRHLKNWTHTISRWRLQDSNAFSSAEQKHWPDMRWWMRRCQIHSILRSAIESTPCNCASCYTPCYNSGVFWYSLVAAYGLAQISTGVFHYEVFWAFPLNSGLHSGPRGHYLALHLGPGFNRHHWGTFLLPWPLVITLIISSCKYYCFLLISLLTVTPVQ